jgi:hypothetical protein
MAPDVWKMNVLSLYCLSTAAGAEIAAQEEKNFPIYVLRKRREKCRGKYFFIA